MVGYFKDRNVKVILWLSGAVNYKCKDTALDKSATYDEAVAKNYGINGSRLGRWWKGEGIHIDFTNPDAKEEFLARKDLSKPGRVLVWRYHRHVCRQNEQ